MTVIDLSKSREFLDPSNVRERIHIIGCGAIGSTLAENLARFGFTKISLYDFDRVEPHNIANQMFTSEDLGKAKVDAVKENILRINPAAEIDIRLFPEGWTNERLSGYVFLCVDNIDLRRKIATENRYNNTIRAMFDFRMGLTDAQHYAADWSDQEMISNFLKSMNFTHEEAKEAAPVSACNITLSVCPTVRIIVASGVANFVNFIKTSEIKKAIFIDAFNFTIDAF